MAATVSASLEGSVLENRSGRPLARSQVTLENAPGAPAALNKTILTDSEGHFSFSSLPAGVYLVGAQKKGYAPAKYGQLQWNGPGTPIVLEEDGHFVAVLRLKKLGAVSGTVFDENQVGLSGHLVNVYKAGPPLKLVATGVTDDRGWYRIAGLEPGRFYVATSARQLEDGHSLLPTFFGGAVEAQSAKPVEIQLDGEVSGADIDPLPGRLFRLGGRAISQAPASLALYSDMGKRDVELDRAGRFTVEQLPPGNYQLLAQSAIGPPMAAYLKLQLSRDMENVSLELAPSPSLRMHWQEDGKPVDARQIPVYIRRKDPPDDKSPQRVLGEENPSLSPGTWEIAAAPPLDLYVRSIFAKNGDVSHEFTLAPGQNLELTILLSSRPAGLKGKVTTSNGQPALAPPVYLSPLEPDLRARLNGGRTVRADLKGEYRFAGLPPGQYRVFSSFAATGPDDAPSLGKPVTLEEGTETVLDLDLQ